MCKTKGRLRRGGSDDEAGKYMHEDRCDMVRKDQDKVHRAEGG
jgi:hypothetical protein